MVFGIDMKKRIVLLLVCFSLLFPVACDNKDNGGSIVPPIQNEQENGNEDSENKGKPVNPIQNGGGITVN